MVGVSEVMNEHLGCLASVPRFVAFPIAYLAGRFPALSETFVYREVTALRRRGWLVQVVSLNDPDQHDAQSLAHLCRSLHVVYGRGAKRTLIDAAAELLRRPGRSLGTFAQSVGDALLPGEPMSLLQRLKLPLQGLAGVGLARRLRHKAVRHIHCHFAHAPATVGMYAARQLQVSFSFVGHANDLFQRRALLRRKLTRAAFVACISHWHREFYRGIVRLPDDQLPVIRCGVDIPDVDGRDRATGRPLSVVSVGRLIAKKGFDVLIRSVGQLVAEGSHVHCRIVGGGPLQEYLDQLIQELGLSNSVKLLGAKTNDEVRRMLQTADLFVLPCRVDSRGDRDGIPVALMEAMAAGVPVISGDLPAIRELVQHERTGLLVPPGDVNALSGAVRRVLSDDQLRCRLGTEGREWVKQEFSCEVNIRRLTDAFAGRASSGEAYKAKQTPQASGLVLETVPVGTGTGCS